MMYHVGPKPTNPDFTHSNRAFAANFDVWQLLLYSPQPNIVSNSNIASTSIYYHG